MLASDRGSFTMSNELQIVKDQKIFMVAANQTISNNNPNQRELYETLITEEFNEFKGAIVENEPLPHQVKEAIDLTTPTPKGMGFLIQHNEPMQINYRGFTVAPKAKT